MRLTTPQAQAVASARKTTHRLAITTRRYRTGQRIPITDGTGTQCHVEVVSVTTSIVVDLTRQQAQAEGFGGARGPLAARHDWLHRYDRAWLTKHEASNTRLTDEAIAARFTERHARNPIIVLTWRLTEAPTRYLAAISGTTHDPKRSIDPDASVIDPDPQYVKRAADLGEQQRASFRRDLEAERREQHRRSEEKRRPRRDAA